MTKVDQLSERPAAKTAVLRSLARCHKRPSVTKQLSWHDTLDCRRLSGTPLDVLTTSVRIPKRLHKLHVPSENSNNIFTSLLSSGGGSRPLQSC